MLKKRIMTGAVFTAVIAAVFCLYRVPYVLNCFSLALSVFGVYELYSVNNIMSRRTAYTFSVLTAVAISIFGIPFYDAVLCVAFPVIIITFACLMIFYGRYSLNNTYKLFLLSLIFPVMFYSFVKIGKSENGLFYLILSVAYCFLNEISAFFIGKKFGKHKLTEKISPSKTVEGSVGGTAASMLLTLAVLLIIDINSALSINYVNLAVYILLASVVGQLGDLSMSVIKRNAGVKDFGNTLPGHGGILDRFDGVLFTAPFTYLFIFLGGQILI